MGDGRFPSRNPKPSQTGKKNLEHGFPPSSFLLKVGDFALWCQKRIRRPPRPVTPICTNLPQTGGGWVGDSIFGETKGWNIFFPSLSVSGATFNPNFTRHSPIKTQSFKKLSVALFRKIFRPPFLFHRIKRGEEGCCISEWEIWRGGRVWK